MRKFMSYIKKNKFKMWICIAESLIIFISSMIAIWGYFNYHMLVVYAIATAVVLCCVLASIFIIRLYLTTPPSNKTIGEAMHIIYPSAIAAFLSGIISGIFISFDSFALFSVFTGGVLGLLIYIYSCFPFWLIVNVLCMHIRKIFIKNHNTGD